MRKITFPEGERVHVEDRLKSNGEIITTRVSVERGKYVLGDKLEYGEFVLAVKRVESFDRLEDHPFYDELSIEMRNDISEYRKFDVVWLEVER